MERARITYGGFARSTTKVRGANTCAPWVLWYELLIVKDNLPAHLLVGLRANRESATLADSNAQVWNEIVTLSAKRQTYLSDDKLLQTFKQLQLASCKDLYPIRRLGTLWRNNRWNQFITKWCRTSIGRSTFGISRFDELASSRLDNVRLEFILTIFLIAIGLLVLVLVCNFRFGTRNSC